MVEWITFRVNSLNYLLLQDLDIRAKSYSNACFAGIWICTAILISLKYHCFTQIEFIYNAIQLLFTWTALANFYLAFFFVSTRM